MKFIIGIIWIKGYKYTINSDIKRGQYQNSTIPYNYLSILVTNILGILIDAPITLVYVYIPALVPYTVI